MLTMETKNEFKLLCKSILDEDISREVLKAYAISYLRIEELKNN